jgi:hypothetical protein
MEAGAASAGGIGGGAKARDRGCNQGCCEKILHIIFSPFISGRTAAADLVSCRVIRHVKYLRNAETGAQSYNGDLNAK